MFCVRESEMDNCELKWVNTKKYVPPTGILNCFNWKYCENNSVSQEAQRGRDSTFPFTILYVSCLCVCLPVCDLLNVVSGCLSGDS